MGFTFPVGGVPRGGHTRPEVSSPCPPTGMPEGGPMPRARRRSLAAWVTR